MRQISEGDGRLCQNAFFFFFLPKRKEMWDGQMEWNPTENLVQMSRQVMPNICSEDKKGFITHLIRLSGEGK